VSVAYHSSEYAESLGEFGEPLRLERAGGWLIQRSTPGANAKDAMGCYPLFCCADWSALEADLAQLDDELVAVSLVTDPFGDFEPESLVAAFPDLMEPFKEHHVVDLSEADGSTVKKQHRYYARRALKSVDVELADEPAAYVDEWTALYSVLADRHGLTGIKAFSRSAFEQQLSVPGVALLVAREGDAVVGAHIWYRDGDVAYSHLAATSARGYELSASYALYWTAIERFRHEARWLDLGAGAGTEGAAGSGLDAFKSGFATGTRPAYLCGRIGDRARYEEIVRATDSGERKYFPAYRAGELG
jgi:hypothetical protein